MVTLLLVSSSDSGGSVPGLVSRPSISIPINIEREDRQRPGPRVTLDEESEVTRWGHQVITLLLA